MYHYLIFLKIRFHNPPSEEHNVVFLSVKKKLTTD